MPPRWKRVPPTTLPTELMRWPIRCAVFDCDGVLLDSNPVKIAAFRAALVDEEPALVERMIAEHRQTGGVSRFAKLEWFYRELARVDAPEVAVASALERFALAARAGLRTCPSVPGIEIWVPELARAGVRMHVISGGEQGELREALEARAWSRHFAGIHGSPTPKHEHLARLFASGELEREGVYFGDAELDMQLAERFGLDFVFVAGVSDWAEGRRAARARGHRVIDDFLALLRPC